MWKLRAGVQYGDWEGTVAADVSDHHRMSNLLKEKGTFDSDTEFLAAIEFDIPENNKTVVDRAYIHALIGPRPEGADWGTQMKEEQHPLRLRRVEVDLSISEFLGLFKRFSLTLTPPQSWAN
jgi:hypothetical protein